MTKQSPFQESTHGHVDDHRGSYPYKNIGGMPINNPYNNLSHPKLETICDHLVRVFQHYKKPYWTNVTLFYPSQLPNDMDTIKDCTTALMEANNGEKRHFITCPTSARKTILTYLRYH